LVVNPAAGVGRARRVVQSVTQVLDSRADVVTYCGTSAAESADLIAACADQVDAVVVVGGDGIVHLALQSLAATPTPLGIIAAGTGNDCAATLGMPADPIEGATAILDSLDRGQRDPDALQRVDLGRTDGGRWWFTVLCAGFDSATNERANAMRWPRGPHRYDVAIALQMIQLRSWAFRITMDGIELSTEATLIAIGNTPGYGGGKLITPAARIDDGRFAITVVAPISRLTLARLATKLPDGGHIGHPAVSTYEATTVTLDAPAALAYVDGERVGPLPVTTTCVPGALRVLAPEPPRSGPATLDG
jgi:diacylglycerol kinase (ATP)